jgi:small subunit ribosomal protein S8
MVTDPIGDMLIQIKNAALIGRAQIMLPHSKMKKAVADILVHEGYLTAAATEGEEQRKKLKLTLAYSGKSAMLTDVKRVSKPGRRTYVPKAAIRSVVGGLGIAILSTSSGIMTDKEARKKGIGGELLCEIW